MLGWTELLSIYLHFDIFSLFAFSSFIMDDDIAGPQKQIGECKFVFVLSFSFNSSFKLQEG
jgi:hypothetical protein